MSVCLFVCLRHWVQFFLRGLSLALRSQDQIMASYWSTIGGGTTVSVLCIGIESRLHMTYYCDWCGGGTNVLVLCIGIESRLHMTNSVVVVVVVLPLYWYYVLVLIEGFR